MSEANKTLKSQNWKYIIPYIGLNFVAFYVMIISTESMWQFTDAAMKSTLWATGLGIMAIILNGFLSNHIKNVLIFWKLHHPLPGCRAFSHYLPSDPRIAPEVLKTRFGQFPSEPTQQNSLWYRIYRKNEHHPSVRDAHASYLLTRDIAALSALFLVTLGPAALSFARETRYALYYIIGLTIIYGLTSQAARTYGKRFVTSVLAIESST